jgi:hypothetical protein
MDITAHVNPRRRNEKKKKKKNKYTDMEGKLMLGPTWTQVYWIAI